ncbi:Amine sulfotransferase [Liparis tanakae]|uniref:Sulfotransferase n=1 Tax=Liparis tanakae TaxID=230148 RepID=A0A4Z2IA13_9TELE|nr:Amine sulfotransferase [Liparis tanakae]
MRVLHAGFEPSASFTLCFYLRVSVKSAGLSPRLPFHALVILFAGWMSSSMDSPDPVSSCLFKHKRMNFLVKDRLRPADLEALQHFEIRPADIFLVTYPKSGTVWMQQILAQVMDAAHPDWAEDATNRSIVPWLEGRTMDNPFRERPDPRIFRSHLPPNMLPLGVKDKQIKVVYVWRNPKDVLVSFYHFAHSWVLLDAPQSFEDFFQQFLDGNDLTDEVIDHVVETSTFKSMKTNPKANYKDLVETDHYKKETMRKGKAGDWRNFFTVAQNEHFDNVFKEKMGNLPLTCIWEIKE